MKNIAIILASGSGSRFGQNIPKQFFKINDKTVLELSVEAFHKNINIDEIIVVTNPDYIKETKQLLRNFSKITKIISGGATRQQSSYNGVFSINYENCNVLIHDAARPFISQKIINDCIAALKTYKAVNVAIDSSDTVFEIDEDNLIKSIPQRKFIKRCQTPQCFDIKYIKQAHKMALNDNYSIATDDCSLVFKYNLADIFVVQGSIDNKKITYISDISC